jgi:hypothetical protein
MNGIEALSTGTIEHADQVDYCVGAIAGRGEGDRKTDIGLHRRDLTRTAQGLEMTGKVRPTHRDPQPIAAPGQRSHDVTADETGASDDGDEPVRK